MFRNDEVFVFLAVVGFVTLGQRSCFQAEVLYASANDPRTANDPGPKMIPDRK